MILSCSLSILFFLHAIFLEFDAIYLNIIRIFAAQLHQRHPIFDFNHNKTQYEENSIILTGSSELHLS